jgi:hypothetical protein
MTRDELRKAQEEMRRRTSGDVASIPSSNTAPSGTAFEKHYTVGDLASLWRMSTRVVRELFRDEEGVIRLMQPGNGKRTYMTIYVPESVARRVHARLITYVKPPAGQKKHPGLRLGLAQKKKPPIRVKEELRKIQAEAKRA